MAELKTKKLSRAFRNSSRPLPMKRVGKMRKHWPLGKHKTGKGCLYINELADVDMKVFKKMLEKALKKK